MRITFDGWIARVGPAAEVERLSERDYCSITGVLSASLALSELFLTFAQIGVLATRRIFALSLWRPDLPPDHPDALGPPVEYLPRDLWFLGLGHLGNAYLWTASALPYDHAATTFMLNDFDKEHANFETGMLFGSGDQGPVQDPGLQRMA